MKNKSTVIVLLILVSLVCCSDQCLGNTIDVVFVSDSDSIISPKVETLAIQNSSIKADEILMAKIDSLEKQIKLLQDNVIALRADTTRLKNEKSELTIHLGKTEAERNRLGSEVQAYKDSLNELRNRISKIDESIYKMCLLLPLELRCNPKAIYEALETVQKFYAFSPHPSMKFTKYVEVYTPLLNNYQLYNDELTNFLKEKLNTITRVGGVIGDGAKQKMRGELEHLSYYQFYLGRNKEPYQSIIYLDDAIDKFKSILDKKGNVQNDISELIKKLEPKLNTKQ